MCIQIYYKSHFFHKFFSVICLEPTISRSVCVVVVSPQQADDNCSLQQILTKERQTDRELRTENRGLLACQLQSQTNMETLLTCFLKKKDIFFYKSMKIIRKYSHNGIYGGFPIINRYQFRIRELFVENNALLGREDSCGK